MRELVASTVYCPDRTVWTWVGEDIWQCSCCGMRIASEDLVEPVDAEEAGGVPG